MARILRFLKSLKLSLGIMVVLLPVIAVGNLVPQAGRASPESILQWQADHPVVGEVARWVGLHHLYTTWWFLLLFAVMFLNMSLVTWGLMGRTRRKARGLHRFAEGEAPEYYVLGTYPEGWQGAEAFEEVVRRRRYRLQRTGGELYARKGWFGIWGGTILHVGFVVLFAGATLSGLTRFDGYTEVGVGQGFREKESSYMQSSRGLLFPGHREDLVIVFEDIEKLSTGKSLQVRSDVAILRGEERVAQKTIWMNEPLYYRGMKVFHGRSYGPAFLFRLDGPGGTNSGYVNVEAYGEKKGGASFTVPGTRYQARVDYDPQNDASEFELRAGKELIYRGPLRAGDTFGLGQDTLTLDAVNMWAGVIVVYDWAVSIVFVGFALCTGGIAVMGLFDPREIWLRTVEKDGRRNVTILGWGRWRNMFLDEFGEMMEEARKWKS